MVNIKSHKKNSLTKSLMLCHNLAILKIIWKISYVMSQSSYLENYMENILCYVAV